MVQAGGIAEGKCRGVDWRKASQQRGHRDLKRRLNIDGVRTAEAVVRVRHAGRAGRSGRHGDDGDGTRCAGRTVSGQVVVDQVNGRPHEQNEREDAADPSNSCANHGSRGIVADGSAIMKNKA
jgi:hypothetical protein